MLSIEREPVVAGTFYSSDPAELITQLKNCFDEVKGVTLHNISALVVPHAGYVYSGRVAASAYALIDGEVEYENIFLIGSSHHVSFKGASVYNRGHYKTPLGVVPVNLKLANALIRKGKNIVFNEAAHAEEHTLEVQLPFLQYRMRHLKQIVPIVVGVKDYEGCKDIAAVLKPYFNSKNLFIISTDFSHYPSDEMAREVDKDTVDAICKNNSIKLIEQLRANEEREIPNLYTGLCGWSSVLTLVHLTEGMDRYKYKKIKYMTSAEAMNRQKDRVVGYQSILVEDEDRLQYVISEEGKEQLLAVAKGAITKCLYKKSELVDVKNRGEFKHLNSAFVSVYVAGELRGCIGRFSAEKDLPVLIEELAVSAAFEDSRFAPVLAEELKYLSVEISVLTPMRKIFSIEEIHMGKHGVYITKDGKRGTFLPQVARKTEWNLEQFLGHLARDKARIGWDGWRDAEIYVFEAIVFSD